MAKSSLANEKKPMEYIRKDNSIIELERQTPIVKEVDVLIVGGGGPGGLPAAIAAAQEGKRMD